MKPDLGAVMEKIDLDGLDPDLEPSSEKLHRLTRIGIGAIPIAGGPLLEIFNSILESPLNKRRTAAMMKIGEALNELIGTGIVTEEALRDNEVFISTVAEVCAISLRNHQSEKFEALKNAVKNSALPCCPSDDSRQIFLNFIDVCTVTHIKLLQIFNNPEEWLERNNILVPDWPQGGVSQVVELALPELVGLQDVYEQIWRDLYLRGFVSSDGMSTTISKSGLLSKRTTKLGAELVAFLSPTMDAECPPASGV